MFGGLFSKTDLDAELNSVELNCVGVVATGQVCGEAHAVEKRRQNSFYSLDCRRDGLRVGSYMHVCAAGRIGFVRSGQARREASFGPETEAKTGRQSTSPVSSSWITALNERAAENNNQVP